MTPLKPSLIQSVHHFNPSGHWIEADPEEMLQNPDQQTRMIVDIDRTHEGAEALLKETFKLPETVVLALLREDTRPRATSNDDGWIINLRGINFNPEPRDDSMIAVRIWATERLILVLRAYPVRAIDDLKINLANQNGPTTTGDIITYLVHRITDRMQPAIEELEGQLDDIELSVVSDGRTETSQLDVLRYAVIDYRRYFAPQREALSKLASQNHAVFSDRNTAELREWYDVLLRLTEDLDALRDRIGVVLDLIEGKEAQRMNQRLFVLSIVSAVFLPLGFITGLFGVNVAGMPGTDVPAAFTVLSIALTVLAIVLAGLFIRAGWLSRSN